MQKIGFILLFYIMTLASCYSGEEIVFGNNHPYVDGGEIYIADSFLQSPGYELNTTWNFEHTYGQKSAYDVSIFNRRIEADALPGPGIDTIYQVERITYDISTKDLSPSIKLRILSHRKHALLAFTETATFTNYLQINDSITSGYPERVIRYHDTLKLQNHTLHNVYEITVEGNSNFKSKGLLYSIKNGIVGFYADKNENYWVRTF